jgi:hypothetical protein
MTMGSRTERQVQAYRELMGKEAMARQLVSTRCVECGGVKPAGHARDCPYWGGREPLPSR